MKELKARVPVALYEKVQRESRASGKSVGVILREALESHLRMDPIFRAFPLFRSKGRGHDNIAERHDEILYGDPHGSRR